MKAQQARRRTKAQEKREEKWPPIRQHIVGGKTYWLVDAGQSGGKRRRFVKKTLGEAETAAAALRALRENEGRDALALPKPLRLDAGRAFALLQPYGASLHDAAEHYVEHVLKFRDAPVVTEVVARMVAAAQKAGRRARTIEDLKYRLETFSRDFTDRQLSSVTLEELQEWLDSIGGSPRTKINFATKLSQLWNHAMRHGWAERNTAALLNRPDVEDEEPGILSVPQAAAMLNNSERFGLLPFVALGLFAGLRTAEIQRLRWEAVRPDERTVIVGAEVAKKRSRRVVEITDALAAWLGPRPRRDGWVLPWRMRDRPAEVDAIEFRDRFEALRKAAARSLRSVRGETAKHAAGLLAWPHNALRHSFGSYSLAIDGNAIRVAAMMGNSAVMVHNHYKALVTKPEAEKFWALRP